MGPRFFEGMLSGRALLLCNRLVSAFAPLGIVEGVHAAMFNSTAEFQATLLYYLHPDHELERLEIVRSARRLALARHTWRRRVDDFLKELPHAVCHQRGGERLSRLSPPPST